MPRSAAILRRRRARAAWRSAAPAAGAAWPQAAAAGPALAPPRRLGRGSGCRAGAVADLAEQRAGRRPSRRPWRRSRRGRRLPARCTSSVTLSVSSSTSGSSAFTASPGFLNQRPTVASVTDSPSVGTRFQSSCRSHGRVRGPAPNLRWLAPIEPAKAEAADIGSSPSASSTKAFSCARCFDIRPARSPPRPGGRHSARASPCRRPGQHPFEIRLDEDPGAHVLRLFLAPDHLGLFEARQFGRSAPSVGKG